MEISQWFRVAFISTKSVVDLFGKNSSIKIVHSLRDVFWPLIEDGEVVDWEWLGD